MSPPENKMKAKVLNYSTCKQQRYNLKPNAKIFKDRTGAYSAG